ncbi:UNVERIFIED_CONTAM: hypothetical protein Sradi_2961500 [Sesamum radiatum]|uniref:Uncharacterized protein n=1 Tax=Sesamum radiatum TaxID=300843 RepID=A0AAW2S0N7_SESRA
MFCVCVPLEGRSGGITMLCQKEYMIHLRAFLRFHVDVDVLPANSVPGRWLTGFYGAAEISQRMYGWDTPKSLRNQSDAPWLCFGDFNEILYQHERTRAARPLRQIHDFRQFSGSKFTWCNKRRAPDAVRARLDRACANPAWVKRFPRYVVSHILSCQSDHKMMLVNMEAAESR